MRNTNPNPNILAMNDQSCTTNMERSAILHTKLMQTAVKGILEGILELTDENYAAYTRG